MKRYSIHSVAELLGISADAIRLYEKEGLVKPLRDEKNGYRYYENEQIHKIMGIHLYRQQDKQKYYGIEKICMNVLNGGEDDKLVKADDVERLKLLCELFDYSRKIDTEV